jgi:hypothetical protein
MSPQPSMRPTGIVLQHQLKAAAWPAKLLWVNITLLLVFVLANTTTLRRRLQQDVEMLCCAQIWAPAFP